MLSGWHVAREWVQTEREEIALGEEAKVMAALSLQVPTLPATTLVLTTLLKHPPSGMSPEKASSPAVLVPARIRMPGLLPFFSWDQSLLGSGSPQNRSDRLVLTEVEEIQEWTASEEEAPQRNRWQLTPSASRNALGRTECK